MQGQADRESSYKGQSRRNSIGKAASSSSKYSCQRAKRCSALEPVLEHCELAIHVAQTCNTSLQPSSSSSKGKSTLRILSRLRDSYVKLMNDVATGADLAGMSSSFYGAGFSGSGAGDRSGDYASVSPNARSSTVNKEAEKEQSFASPPRACA